MPQAFLIFSSPAVLFCPLFRPDQFATRKEDFAVSKTRMAGDY